MATKTTAKRAITLAGGGPAAGLHVGALIALDEAGIEFDVWSLSCIGAWVGIVYNTRLPPLAGQKSTRGRQTQEFFRENVFRDNASYDWFPVNRAFAPDFKRAVDAWLSFPLDRANLLGDLVQPGEIFDATGRTMEFLADPKRWNEAGVNGWLLNDVLAVHPVSRFLTSLIYLSKINGLARIYYDDSPFLAQIPIAKMLTRPDAPEIYHNAWRLPREGEGKLGGGAMQIFNNRYDRPEYKDRGYLRITPKSLCACSALPYVEETVEIDGHTYCEGALVDTVNFKDLLRDHPGLEEVWVSRIVDTWQVTAPTTIADGLANLAMLFAAEVGANDVKLFRQHAAKRIDSKPRIVEIPIVPGTGVRFAWNHENFDAGVREGYAATTKLLAKRKADDDAARASARRSVGADRSSRAARTRVPPVPARPRSRARAG